MVNIAFSAVAFAVLVGSCYGATCGTFQASCGSYYKNPSLNGDTFLGHIQFDGLWAGNYTWTRSVFQGPSCGTFPLLHIWMNGSWIDFNTDSSVQEGLLYMTASSVLVIPGSADVISYLSTACPCGQTWTLNRPSILTQCTVANCPDTTWLGGTPSSVTGAQGYIIGEPFYASVIGPQWGTNSGFVISYLDASSIVGWSNDFPLSGNNYTGQACLAPLTTPSICGSWNEYCSPSALAVTSNFQSVTAHFNYEGPVPQPGKILNSDSGTYFLRESYWIDTDCTYPYLNISHNGVLSYVGASSTIVGGYVIARNAPYVEVTPITNGSAKWLNNACPCGSSWSMGVSRYLTSCPAGSCNNSFIFHNGAFGQVNYGTVQAYASASYQQLRFTEFSPSLATIPTSFTSADQPMVDDHACTFSISQGSFCGIYHQQCATNPNDAGYDYVEQLTYGTAAQGTLGSYSRNKTFFVGGDTCQTPVGYFTESGTYQLGCSSTVSTGAYNYKEVVTSSNATITDAGFLAIMNANCSCGGSWQLNVPRTITACSTCNIAFIGQVSLGVSPGYGNILVYPYAIRRTQLSTTPNIGYATPLGLTDFPFTYVSFFCPGAIPQPSPPPALPCPTTPQASSSKSSGTGGTVFLILLFVGGFVYFAAGMALNYKKTGSATIPHSEFWRSLPGLIVAGAKFSTIEGFGLLSTPSSSGYTPQTNKHEGYGTLGE